MNIERLVDMSAASSPPEELYEKLAFPAAPVDRPYVYINMAATVDGKVVVGPIGGVAKGVGGPTDQILFRRLQGNCDAAILGAGSIRASNVIYPKSIARYTITTSGDLSSTNRFFTDNPEQAYVFVGPGATDAAVEKLKSFTNVIRLSGQEPAAVEALRIIRERHGIRTLLCEGGPSLNASMFKYGLAHELFLTISPKLKGGGSSPSIFEGEGFPDWRALPLSLISAYRDAGELYLRYRVSVAPIDVLAPSNT